MEHRAVYADQLRCCVSGDFDRARDRLALRIGIAQHGARALSRLLLRGTAGRRVQIPDWSVFLEIYDGAIETRRRRQRTSKASA